MAGESTVVAAKRMLLFGVALLAGALLLWWGLSLPYTEARSIGKNVKNFKELSGRFETLAKEKGGEYAFEVLRRAELPPNTDLHLLGHVVGDELYLQEGVDGITVCTQDFRNACSHSIVIGALNEFGEGALPMIRDACRKAPGGSGAYTMCFHGLGHGVFAYYQYSIPETVDFCKSTGTQEYKNREYIECVGGMVMELMGGGGHDKESWFASRAKYLSRDTPLAPCDEALIPSETKPVCYMYLTPRLWELAGINPGKPDAALFSKAFGLCESIPKESSKERDACLGGFGKEFVPLAGSRDIRRVEDFSDEQLDRVHEWCREGPHAEARGACVKEALASFFWGGENDPEISFRFCALAGAEEKNPCFGALLENIRAYTVGDTRSRLCERLPAEFKEDCAKPL